MTNWATTAEADTYLSALPNTDAWFDTDIDTDQYLTKAHILINNDPDLTIPSSPTDAQTTLLQKAEIELAFYILNNPNFGKRQNLQSQGVKSMRIGDFSETYVDGSAKNRTGYSQYPVEVYNYLYSFRRVPSYIVNITRDQENII